MALTLPKVKVTIAQAVISIICAASSRRGLDQAQSIGVKFRKGPWHDETAAQAMQRFFQASGPDGLDGPTDDPMLRCTGQPDVAAPMHPAMTRWHPITPCQT